MTVLLTAHNEKERETSKTFIMGEIHCCPVSIILSFPLLLRNHISGICSLCLGWHLCKIQLGRDWLFSSTNIGGGTRMLGMMQELAHACACFVYIVRQQHPLVPIISFLRWCTDPIHKNKLLEGDQIMPPKQ